MKGRGEDTHISQLLLILDHQLFVDLHFWRGKGRCSNEFEPGVTNPRQRVSTSQKGTKGTDAAETLDIPDKLSASHKNGRSKL